MSAFVCGSDHFKALAIFAASRIGGYGAAHIAVDPRYVDGLQESAKQLSGAELAAVYANILYAENIRSVSARYPKDDIDNLPGRIHKPAQIKITARDTVNTAYRLPAVALLKMCDCLEYQSCETEDYRSTLAFDLTNAIRKAAWKSLPGYEDAPWDYEANERKAA